MGHFGVGTLTGKYNQGAEGQGRAKAWSVPERNLAIAQEVMDTAQEIGVTTSQVAIAWVLAEQDVYHAPFIPIIGARNVEQRNDNLNALNVKLSDEQLKRLNDATRIEPGFPHDYLAGSDIRMFMFGGMYERIHNHRK